MFFSFLSYGNSYELDKATHTHTHTCDFSLRPDEHVLKEIIMHRLESHWSPIATCMWGMGSAAMATIRFYYVPLEVNLKNMSCTGDKACKRGNLTWL